MLEAQRMGVAESVTQAWHFVRYVARHFPAFKFALVVTAIALILEYAAASLMIPLAGQPSGGASLLIQGWRSVAKFLGMADRYRTWLWLFLALLGLRMIIGLGLAILTAWLGKQVHLSLSGEVFGHIVRNEPMRTIYERSVGHYISLAGDDTFKSGTLVSSILQVLVGALSALMGMVVLCQFSVQALVLLVAFLVLCLVLVGAGMALMLKSSNRAIDLSREATTTFVETLNSLRSVRSLKGEGFVARTYGEQMRAYVRQLVQVDTLRTLMRTTPALVLILVGLLALAPGINLGVADATVFAATLIIMRVFAALGQLLTSGGQLISDIRAMKDIEELVRIAELTPQPTPADKATYVASLELSNITFSYDGMRPVLENFSRRFEHGRFYAVVGPSGGGKSTLADIALGLTVPSEGRIIVNDGTTTLAQIRSRVVLVEQQPKIFSSTVRENLLLGGEASDEALFAALAAVDMDQMVHNMANGLDTRLTYLGENFSGGQRQRLGIARALVHKPDVLILDEATSALDLLTRQVVVTRLREIMKSGIVLFITHDEEIAALADDVVVIGSRVASRGIVGISA